MILSHLNEEEERIILGFGVSYENNRSIIETQPDMWEMNQYVCFMILDIYKLSQALEKDFNAFKNITKMSQQKLQYPSNQVPSTSTQVQGSYEC